MVEYQYIEFRLGEKFYPIIGKGVENIYTALFFEVHNILNVTSWSTAGGHHFKFENTTFTYKLGTSAMALFIGTLIEQDVIKMQRNRFSGSKTYIQFYDGRTVVLRDYYSNNREMSFDEAIIKVLEKEGLLKKVEAKVHIHGIQNFEIEGFGEIRVRLMDSHDRFLRVPVYDKVAEQLVSFMVEKNIITISKNAEKVIEELF